MSVLRVFAFAAFFLFLSACGSRMTDRPDMNRANLGSVSPAGEDRPTTPVVPDTVLADPNQPGGRTAVSPPIHDINDPPPVGKAKTPAKKKKKK